MRNAEISAIVKVDEIMQRISVCQAGHSFCLDSLSTALLPAALAHCTPASCGVASARHQQQRARKPLQNATTHAARTASSIAFAARFRRLLAHRTSLRITHRQSGMAMLGIGVDAE